VLGIVVRARKVRGFRTPEGEVEMWVRMDPADLQNLNDLESVIVGAGPAGEPIELRQVASFGIEKIPARIRREDRRSFTYVNGVYTGEKREEGQKIFTQILNDYPFPEGYGWSFGFWTQRQQQENQEFVFNILLALFMVYFVMASLFESLAHPFAIMFSLPFAIVGVALFLWATRSPFNVMGWIGTLVLIGIVVNNGIVLIDHINNLRRKGMERAEAIREGCRERLRPIVMTAATTVVGLIPLAFGDQGFFDMKYFPMARTVMGGLMASTVLTLLVLPAYYTLMDDFAVWCRRIWQNSAAAAPRPVDASAPGD
jgi:HAE1 family hydrophobic/amphiphilic exporter-1